MATQLIATPDTGQLEELVRRAVADALANERETKTKKIAMIATKGTLDWAYPPLVLAGTAASLGWDAGIFFTFYGLNIIHKGKRGSLEVAPIANPAMPMPMPFPNIGGVIPGMT